MRIGNAIVATGILLLAALSGIASAGAQATDVRFVLDFLLQGQQSPFVLGRERFLNEMGVQGQPGRGIFDD